jgi:hypothetical protein
MVKALPIVVAPGIWCQLTPFRSQTGVPKLTECYRGNFFDINWVDKLDRNGRPFADHISFSREGAPGTSG